MEYSIPNPTNPIPPNEIITDLDHPKTFRIPIYNTTNNVGTVGILVTGICKGVIVDAFPFLSK